MSQSYSPSGSAAYKDPNTAFLIELVGGIFGLLGLGHFYVGRTNDGLIRLIGWWVIIGVGWCIVAALTAVVIGLLCIPVMGIAQIAIPLWSAYNLKAEMTGTPGFMPLQTSKLPFAPAASPAGAPPPPPAQPSFSQPPGPAAPQATAPQSEDRPAASPLEPPPPDVPPPGTDEPNDQPGTPQS